MSKLFYYIKNAFESLNIFFYPIEIKGNLIYSLQFLNYNSFILISKFLLYIFFLYKIFYINLRLRMQLCSDEFIFEDLC